MAHLRDKAVGLKALAAWITRIEDNGRIAQSFEQAFPLPVARSVSASGAKH